MQFSAMKDIFTAITSSIMHYITHRMDIFPWGLNNSCVNNKTTLWCSYNDHYVRTSQNDQNFISTIIYMKMYMTLISFLLDIRQCSNFRHIKGRRNFIQLVEGDICHYDIIKGKTFEGTSKHRERIYSWLKKKDSLWFSR